MRTLFIAFVTTLVRAQFLGSNPTIFGPGRHKSSDKFLDDQRLIISTGTYPCIFKIDDSFYDYTPLKVGASEAEIIPEAVYISNPELHYYYNWCEYLSETKDPVCSGHYYAAGKNNDEEGCVAYSGDSPTKDIEATKISGNVLYTNGTTADLNGIQLKYSNGAKCPSSPTNDGYTFSINVYCDPDVKEIDYLPFAHGDECSPYVNIIS